MPCRGGECGRHCPDISPGVSHLGMLPWLPGSPCSSLQPFFELLRLSSSVPIALGFCVNTLVCSVSQLEGEICKFYRENNLCCVVEQLSHSNATSHQPGIHPRVVSAARASQTIGLCDCPAWLPLHPLQPLQECARWGRGTAQPKAVPVLLDWGEPCPRGFPCLRLHSSTSCCVSSSSENTGSQTGLGWKGF